MCFRIFHCDKVANINNLPSLKCECHWLGEKNLACLRGIFLAYVASISPVISEFFQERPANYILIAPFFPMPSSYYIIINELQKKYDGPSIFHNWIQLDIAFICVQASVLCHLENYDEIGTYFFYICSSVWITVVFQSQLCLIKKFQKQEKPVVKWLTIGLKYETKLGHLDHCVTRGEDDNTENTCKKISKRNYIRRASFNIGCICQKSASFFDKSSSLINESTYKRRFIFSLLFADLWIQ